MNQYDDVLRKLEGERQRLIGAAVTAKQQGKTKTKADAEGRAAYLAGVARALRRDAHGGILPSHVFVTYAERTGCVYCEYVRKQLVEKHGLVVKTGFDKDPSHQIRKQNKNCLFVQ